MGTIQSSRPLFLYMVILACVARGGHTFPKSIPVISRQYDVLLSIADVVLQFPVR